VRLLYMHVHLFYFKHFFALPFIHSLRSPLVKFVKE